MTSTEKKIQNENIARERATRHLGGNTCCSIKHSEEAPCYHNVVAAH